VDSPRPSSTALPSTCRPGRTRAQARRVLLLDPVDLRSLAALLDDSGGVLSACSSGGGAQVWPAPAREAVCRAAEWSAEAACLLRRRAGLAEDGERLALPAAAPLPAGPRGSGAALVAVLAAAPPDPRLRAEAVARHLGALTADERAALVRQAPDLVGPLDGAPEQMRYAANAALLRRALAAAVRHEAALPPGQRAGLPGVLARRRIVDLRALLRPRRGADGRLAPRQWLALDLTRGGRGVEVVGATRATASLAEARAVAVLVPGMGSRLLPPAPGWTAGAGRLAGEAARLAGPGTVVVAWQGYDAPVGADALSARAAQAGGQELAVFLHGLGATTPASLSLLGHSYGSVVVGGAARSSAEVLGRPLPVRAIAVYGSPGLGRGVQSVADLRLAPGTEVYALAAPGDAVAWSGWHGENPVERDTGVVRLETGAVAGHSSYLDAGSVSLSGLALVAAGRGAAARRAPSAPDGGPIRAAVDDLGCRRVFP
jgi:hypothetical protein